jgi:diguanylate cyclase (GGDEF)-like protein/PAS domain S-box-containing protein
LRRVPLRAQFAAIIEATPDGIAITDPQGALHYLNRAGRALLGLADITDQNILDFLPERARTRVLQEGIATALRTGHWRDETVVQNRQGREIAVSQTLLAHTEGHGTVAFLSFTLRDISEQKRYEAELAQLAHSDALTGLSNRYRFQEELESRLAQLRRYGAQGALFFIDVDELKGINDRWGHQAGDAFLFSLAALLRERLREVDVVARFGGDEFAVLLSPPDAAQVQVVARRLLKATRQHAVTVVGQQVASTVSIGIALFPQHGVTSEEILANADLALYRAKADGRNTYRIYTPDMKRER